MEVKIVVPMALRIFNKVAKHYKWTVFVIILFNIGSIVVSIVQKDFNWLAASGGVTSIVGLLLTVSHSVPKTEVDVQNYVAAMFPKSRDGIMADPPKNRGGVVQTESIIEKANKVLRSESLGIIITIIGTLIWAYSGFLTDIVFPK
ncbi:hypothetical protein AB4453_16960 [Vibrio atlanticus]|uniref:hypothetical protein n=1 Tax=Vibrio TaxID=662 RepID=UPI000C819636|nr:MULTISPECIES: hypothetical protein [Vibrio]TKF03655.1 hypothetical protein FCV46_12375 [Vibrio kanaloae]TKF64544.1 hypothetical protein FCV51_03305 [Vibrio kanaloae]